MAKKPAFIPLEREDRYGPFRLMAYAEGYVMARRKGCAPFVCPLAEWVALHNDKQQPVPLRPVS